MPQQQVLSFFDAHRLSVRYKFPLPKQMVVQSMMDALKAADQIGFPVVLKLLSPDFVHKTENHLVMRDIRSPQELSKAYHEVIERAQKAKRNVRIEGILIQEYVEGDVQVIIGGKKDPSFGPVVIVGAGGIFAELLDDSVVRVCPLTLNDAEEMLSELKMKKVFEGFRGIKVDEKAVAEAILRVSALMMNESNVKEIDINPLIVLPHGVSAVDVRVVV